ncbi:conserved protein, unknown function [Hepatocystis sp. ex Piliocolobus tephrosceles]|nr:conserved protein, unknown function [Hepatocystis sp. ex Piliocolobus tephrosceles]
MDLLLKILAFIIGYLIPIGLSLHGCKNQKHTMVEYYLKYIFFIVIYETFIATTIGLIIYKISKFIWCLLNLSIYILFLTPKFNYLNMIYDKAYAFNKENNVSLQFNNYFVKPLSNKLNNFLKKMKTK